MKKRFIIYGIIIFISLVVFAAGKIKEYNSYYYVNEDLKPQHLARLAAEKYIAEDRIVNFKGKLIGVNIDRAGVFVSIYKNTPNGIKLRGCIGTYGPTQPDVAQEIIISAIASTKDFRFEKVRKDELPSLFYSVDILSPTEPVESPDELDPKKYGIVVSSGLLRRGILLPDIGGVDTIEQQLAITREKAGIEPDEHIKIERFTVERFSEK